MFYLFKLNKSIRKPWGVFHNNYDVQINLRLLRTFYVFISVIIVVLLRNKMVMSGRYYRTRIPTIPPHPPILF